MPDNSAIAHRLVKIASKAIVAGSIPQSPPVLAVTAANHNDRQIAALLLALALPWLTYTRLYFWLHPRHLTFDGGLFMWMFNKPDPACGLTRTFAWMWRGDFYRAVSVYPLGPLLFVGTILVVLWALAALLLGRTSRLSLSGDHWRVLIAISVIALALNWASKLIWLGM